MYIKNPTRENNICSAALCFTSLQRTYVKIKTQAHIHTHTHSSTHCEINLVRDTHFNLRIKTLECNHLLSEFNKQFISLQPTTKFQQQKHNNNKMIINSTER